MPQISIGKYHRLLKCSSPNRTFSILAIDHRTSLMKALSTGNDKSVNSSTLVEFKKNIVSRVGVEADAILIDPEYGAPHCIASGNFGTESKLIISIEKSGYRGPSNLRHSEILKGWSVKKSERIGADAVKLLVYYHPKSETSFEIESLVLKISKACEELDMPLFLEPLTYSLDINEKKLTGNEKRSLVVEVARRLSKLGPDILKMEFPLDISCSEDENVWKEACLELSEACQIPWVLLSAGVDYESYVDQVRIACECGASGIAVGRAIWKEAVSMTKDERETFLSKIAKNRMHDLNMLCSELAKPWSEVYTPPTIKDDWYATY